LQNRLSGKQVEFAITLSVKRISKTNIMSKLKIRGNDLKMAGVPPGPLAGLAVAIAKKHYRAEEYDRFLRELALVSKSPDDFIGNPVWDTYANKLVIHNEIQESKKEIPLNEQPAPYQAWGIKNIESGAINQMDIAVHLPVTHSGALMPDAHHGYGLPIGGVLGVKNAVIPYGVGMDIGCRMCLSVFPMAASYVQDNSYLLKEILKANSALWTSLPPTMTWAFP
jgi:tRNA-splicing ligase RtcB